MRIFLMAMALIGAMIVPAHAEKVYEREFGHWTISGFVEPDDRFCVVNTFSIYDERFQINVFPNVDDTYVTMTIRNFEWSMDKYDPNDYTANISFYFADGGVDESIETWQVKDSDRVIFRNMNALFIENFMRADTMDVEFGNQTYTVDLKNSIDAMEALAVCLQAVVQ
jgi:hypothetical protein